MATLTICHAEGFLARAYERLAAEPFIFDNGHCSAAFILPASTIVSQEIA